MEQLVLSISHQCYSFSEWRLQFSWIFHPFSPNFHSCSESFTLIISRTTVQLNFVIFCVKVRWIIMKQGKRCLNKATNKCGDFTIAVPFNHFFDLHMRSRFSHHLECSTIKVMPLSKSHAFFYFLLCCGCSYKECLQWRHNTFWWCWVHFSPFFNVLLYTYVLIIHTSPKNMYYICEYAVIAAPVICPDWLYSGPEAYMLMYSLTRVFRLRYMNLGCWINWMLTCW